MTEEFKPCPYCQSTKVEFELSCGIMGHVICLNCTARGSLCDEEQAIISWNNRAEPLGNSEELNNFSTADLVRELCSRDEVVRRLDLQSGESCSSRCTGPGMVLWVQGCE